MAARMVTVDANEAVASVAHRSNEVIAIYPITPASPMGEHADEWSAAGRKNLWGAVPRVQQLQSEGGAAGTVHGALQAGSLATTFTASQGLLLMIPNLYKIAGELLPFCLHVAARTLATHALSIFGDHSDVMACRQTGFAMLCAGDVQEAQDFAAVAQATTLTSRVPFLHFFDGFRTSHEIAKIAALSDDDLRALYDEEAIAGHRARALTPDHPSIRGTAQNPDVFFQAREASNPFHDAVPAAVAASFERFAALTGRRYRLFDYVGHPQAERVLVLMGSGAEAAHVAVERLAAAGEKVGVVKVRLYRPFDRDALLAALPPTTKAVAVLDRTKEPGAVGEPLYLDVVAALARARAEGVAHGATGAVVVGGRYGLSSKEFTPSMAKAALDALATSRPPHGFTLGIVDDVSFRSLPHDPAFDTEPDDVVRAVFYGLGSDGTVSSNKNTIKIIGGDTPNYAQGYFVYDSKKSGATTVSHLRFGPRPVRAPWLVRRASFVAVHDPKFLETTDVFEVAAPGATFLLNTPVPAADVFAGMPREAQEAVLAKRLKVYAIDGASVAEAAGLGRRISSVMQTCFFALSGVLPRDEAIEKIRKAAEKSYGRRGAAVVRANFAAIDAALAHLHPVPVPAEPTTDRRRRDPVAPDAPDFVRRVTAVLLAGKGDALPVSAFRPDGTWPTGTARYEKRAIGLDLPVWDEGLCIQCGKCAFVCPHAAIRSNAYPTAALANAPAGFRSVAAKGGDLAGLAFTIQVAPDDCTGCGLCVAVCPAKDRSNPRHKALDMAPAEAHRDVARPAFDFFLGLPDLDPAALTVDVKGSQLREPLFEFSGACAGCGETPYLKLLSQLFGDRALIANATGCSSIYGGNLPTTPWRADAAGRGPAWANSLFEDNAEFGLGFRLAADAHATRATLLLQALAPRLGGDLVAGLLEGMGRGDEAGLAAQRARVAALREALGRLGGPEARALAASADALVKKSVWIVGGDGWAYDIGYGGLDHVLASHHDVNVLVLDTEVYSNTGGQASKATPVGAAAKFASAGKEVGKKDLGLLAMSYGHVYVARVAWGARDAQTVRAFAEAEAYPGPSLILAYSPCIAHGYDLVMGGEQQKLAVASGIWPLYRYDPRRTAPGEAPLELDSGAPTVRAREFMKNEGRFRSVALADPKRYARLVDAAELQAAERRAMYEHLSGLRHGPAPAPHPMPAHPNR
ncbi:MAG: pyruvate:ferredoxin (flavodoxin) oxidoreductase [Planctomycetota bacterium]